VSESEARLGRLLVVATPIGNLGDVSRRAAESLASCDRVAAEDTRRTRQLLSHLGVVGKPVDALHAHSSDRDVARMVSCLEAGETIALVTDAGTPAVSDPGDALVKAAIRAGVPVVPIPGPSAVLAALVTSGLGSGGGFRFLGFLPREGAARREAIAKVCETPEPVILFESPERTSATLTELADAMPDRAAKSTSASSAARTPSADLFLPPLAAPPPKSGRATPAPRPPPKRHFRATL